MRYDHAARALSTALVLGAGGCVADADDSGDSDQGEVVDSAATEEEPVVVVYGCWTYSDWSDIAYEGAGYETATIEGSVKGALVGRSQRIQLRESHEFSIQSQTTSIVGEVGASEWQWFAKCPTGSDYTSRWLPLTAEVFFGSGCDDWVETTYLQVRVRAANC